MEQGERERERKEEKMEGGVWQWRGGHHPTHRRLLLGQREVLLPSLGALLLFKAYNISFIDVVCVCAEKVKRVLVSPAHASAVCTKKGPYRGVNVWRLGS